MKEKELLKKFGKTFQEWYPKIKNEKLAGKFSQVSDCNVFFPHQVEINYDESTWNDFSKFMTAYNTEMRTALAENNRVENKYASSVNSLRNQLNANTIDFFNSLLESRRANILVMYTENRSYSSSKLGSLIYSVNETKFDELAFQAMADEVFSEQWKNNSLNTGAMPYSYCFGSSNYCDDYGCSKISVITGGEDDVLVTIKNSSGEVVRHGYIIGGSSFTFNVPDGTYQVFFYSGSGWNPKKFMGTTTCGELHGGFVSRENVTKDNHITLLSQKMTYELIRQEGGNLITQPSSKSEAF
jgi:hypothetical protein